MVSEQPFEFSEAPAKWGPCIGAVAMAILSLGAGHLTVRHHAPAAALLFGLAGFTIVSSIGARIARTGTLGMRWARSRSANLVAVRRRESSARPRLWLVAHLDSKSQTIPMLLRIAAVVAFALCFAGMLAAMVAMLATQSADLRDRMLHVVHVMSVLASVSLLPIILCFIGNRSPGAADNASGVASVLLAAEMPGHREDVGVLLTSGEELGLAGARAFARDEAEAGTAINCDTIDDDGRFICMASGRKSGRLDSAIDRAATRLGIDTLPAQSRRRDAVRLRGMIPGILADNIAFTDAGWESFTLSRGNLGTLARVHTSRDRAELIEGTGIAHAARLLAAIVEELS